MKQDALDHAGEHPSSQPESSLVDAPADALLQVWSPKIDEVSDLSSQYLAAARSWFAILPRVIGVDSLKRSA